MAYMREPGTEAGLASREPRAEDIEAAALTMRGRRDPREALCQTACRLLQADRCSLWEPAAVGMVLGAFAGDGPTPRRPQPVVDQVRRDGGSVFGGSVLAEPLLRDEVVTGVLVLEWREPVVAVGPRGHAFLHLVLAQAALAIERNDAAAAQEHLALTDDLTGLSNRRALERELGRELARARRHRTNLGVALLDIDHFKDFNDHHGHQAGDVLLRRSARAWLASARAQDVLARYGGDEFALVLPSFGTERSACAAVERIRQATPAGQTASAGLALWDGFEGEAALLRRADSALYAAKARGRDRTVLAGRRAAA